MNRRGNSRTRIRVTGVILAFLICLGRGAFAEGNERPRVLVALGDSYICGEGIEPYYGQDAPMSEKCKDPDWLAHRSAASWPGMLTLPGVEGTLAEHRGENFFFAAASSAQTNNLFLLTEAEKAAGFSAELEKPYRRDGIAGTAMLPPQLDIFDELDEKSLKADYVVLMIGGNDVDFRGIITMSLFGQTSSLPGVTLVDKGVSLLEKQYETANVREQIRRVFRDVAARAGEQATIIAAGYPYPLIDDAAGTAFTRESARIMNEANLFFCMELTNLVAECHEEGMKICYVGVNNLFNGHGAYAEDPYINPIILMAGEQDLESTMMVNSASLHPNSKGAQAYALCVQDAIDQLEAGTDRYIFDIYGLVRD